MPPRRWGQNGRVDGKLSRRILLGGTLAAVPVLGAAQTSAPSRKMIKPPALKQGDRVAVVAPAGAADDQAHIDRALAKLRDLGFAPVVTPNILKRHGYLAGTDDQRAADLNLAFADPSFKAIFALRGGYGVSRLLHLLDYESLRQNPKVVLGYSDITALHNAIVARAGIVSFHGPCGESTWNAYARESLLRVCMQSGPAGPVPAPEKPEGRHTLMPGKGRGVLVGGNLSLVVATYGTPYLPDLTGKIVVLEDIGEDPYRVDRMLTHLFLGGQITKAAGIVFGNFRDRPRAGDTPPEAGKTFSLQQVLEDRCRTIGVPAFRGLPMGHLADNHVIPFGVEAEMDADCQTLTLVEPAVGGLG